ncbi:MAG: GNAT family N-acetyltransferase [Caldilineaceae bacterium]|jgi:ribosomal protein S18 acetylase RimI-like enzyme|nr:GNAT family N-acetyltransferase [Caldilineaceae bacterium]
MQLVPITPQTYAAAVTLSVQPDQVAFVASVQKSLADAYVYSDALFRLAVQDNKIVGYLLLFPYQMEQRRVVNIVRLMIDQQYQGAGLGRALLEAALAWIASFEPAVERVRISTLARNTLALSLYKKVGFVEKGIEEGEIALYLDLLHG